MTGPLFLRPYFARAARRELELRKEHYPAMVDAGTLERSWALEDIAAWRLIEALFRTGSVETRRSWAVLEHASANALQRREEALAACPEDVEPQVRQQLIARRDAVWGIHERISWHRAQLQATPSERSEAE